MGWVGKVAKVGGMVGTLIPAGPFLGEKETE